MKPPAEYWVTVGTIFPVLALALVVEARSLAARWTSHTPRVLRAVQTLLWVSPLIAATVSEAGILRALRGETVSSWVSRLCDVTVLSSFAVLVLSPAIDLAVRGYAEFLARVLAARPVQLIKILRLGRSMEREQRASRRWRKKLEADRPLVLSMLDDIDAMIDNNEAEGTPAEQVQQMRARLADRRTWTAQQFAEQDAKWDAVEAHQAQAREAYRQGHEGMRTQLADLRRLWTYLLIRDGLAGQGGLQHPTTTNASHPGESALNDGDASLDPEQQRNSDGDQGRDTAA